MIEVLEKIPKIYERTVLSEYYRFFQNLNGSKDIINKNLYNSSIPYLPSINLYILFIFLLIKEGIY